jgi:ADP-heptose:LPS heptosyltransferase
MAEAPKILAIQFKYLGDAVFLVPALRALKEYRPDCELHVLVAAEAAPVLEHLPWLTKVWPMPRTRGKARIRESWPIIRALRRERFDFSVDFVGNDRGAILSFLCGARQRLGALESGRWWGRKFCYTQTVPADTLPDSWVRRHLGLLAACQIPPPRSAHLEVYADPMLSGQAASLLPDARIICHITTSQPKKEWPVSHWAEFYRLAAAAGHALAFSSGTSDRERARLDELKAMKPEIVTLPPTPDLRLFLAILKRAKLVVAGDTGPLHFAAALGVPVIGLYVIGDSLLHTAPIYQKEHVIVGGPCICDTRFLDSSICQEVLPCMASIQPYQVLQRLDRILGAAGKIGR